MIWPLPHIQVSSPFGDRIHPITGANSFHNGVDFAAALGTPIVAPASGVVEKVYSNSTGGNQIIIKHSFGRTTGYAHLQDVWVQQGERVYQGDEIGTVGSTGASTGPHLHYTYKKNGEYKDPMKVYHGISNRAIALSAIALVVVVLMLYFKNQ